MSQGQSSLPSKLAEALGSLVPDDPSIEALELTEEDFSETFTQGDVTNAPPMCSSLHAHDPEEDLPPSESELIEQAKENADAFGELYQRYVDRIYSYIFHRTGSEEDAEDLTAHTFYKALTHIHRYKDRGAPFAAWLYRIAHNTVANWHRDNSRWTELPLEGLTLHDRPEHTPHQAAEDWDKELALTEALHRLHPDRQLLLILKFSEGLSNSQIGQIMGRTEGAVKSLYHRTLVALRENLQQQGYTFDEGDRDTRYEEG